MTRTTVPAFHPNAVSTKPKTHGRTLEARLGGHCMLLSLPMEMTWGHMEENSFLCSSFFLVTGLFSRCTDSLAFALKTSVTTSFKILQIWAAILEVGPLTLRSILGESLGYQPIASIASTHHPQMHLFSSYSPLRIQVNTSLMPSLVGPCFLHFL